MSSTKYGGYMEFYYTASVKDSSGNTTKEQRFVRIDLGIITSLTETLSKSGTANSLVSMGTRYSIYIDSENTMSIQMKLERLSPSRDAVGEGVPPKTLLINGQNVFGWFDTVDGKTVVKCLDQQQVTANMQFAGESNNIWQDEVDGDTDDGKWSKRVFNSSKYWTNAYWIKGFQKINDRWQMKFDGADFVYWPLDDLTGYIRPISRHVYASSLMWTIKAGCPEVLECDLNLTVGRSLRKMTEEQA